MRRGRRIIEDESGMTLPLAIMMIVIIGVMGAGLLTFVSRDLNTVIEENRGQRAFELADAGVNAAKRQLFADCGSNTGCKDHYDDTTSTVVGMQDYRWSAARSGVTLNDLNGDGNASDYVNVTIAYSGSTANPYGYTIVSTGHYGSATRKIEAKLKGIGGAGGNGNNIVNPGYYTPSSILIEGTFETAGVSLFSEKDIIIKTLNPKTRAGFQTDASTNAGGALRGANSNDPLDDWYSPNLVPPDNWNLVKRTREAPSTQSYSKVGYAAVGRICSPSITTSNSCLSSDPSVADGVYGYDSTTGDTTDPTLTAPSLHSNLKQFYVKDPPCTVSACPTPSTTQPSNKITFPFPRVRPDPSRLKTLAQNNPRTNTFWGCPTPSSTCTPPWGTTLFPTSAANEQVVFVDAKNNNLTLDISNQSTGVLVVWCGNLTLRSPFRGIIIGMYGDGTSFGASNCAGDPSKGLFTLETATNENVQAWVYAEGGTDTPTTLGTPGITFRNGTQLKAVPGGGDLASIAFGTGAAPPTSFEIEGWRELYE